MYQGYHKCQEIYQISSDSLKTKLCVLCDLCERIQCSVSVVGALSLSLLLPPLSHPVFVQIRPRMSGIFILTDNIQIAIIVDIRDHSCIQSFI